MVQDQVRQDIAFIRNAIEEGGSYAAACSPDLMVWGTAVALGYLGTFAFIRGWLSLTPNWIWAICLGLPWLYSLRRVPARVSGRAAASIRGPMARAMSMLWLGCGVFLTTLALAVLWSNEAQDGWFGAVAAGVLGIAFFVSAWLSNLGWLRGVAVAWWIGEFAAYGLRHRAEALPLLAALMLILLAGPGAVLMARQARMRRARAGQAEALRG
ncbi:MAG: hypothetical protein JO305_05195 [Alphaproteobacteria bacterium]|nr:hypothetical protein [Alphaproteobacteria bacterium]